jgi:hypothetical protein
MWVDERKQIVITLLMNFHFKFQLVVPKRAAMLLDRLMVALHHALEDDDPKQVQKITDLYRSGQVSSSSMPSPISSSVSLVPHKSSQQPKYYKGKTEPVAYYGYKMINGQAGDFHTYI